MAKLNIELLKRLRMRFLRMRHPKHFNMKEVVMQTTCGTAMCIAGHALDLEGYKYKPTTDEWIAPTGRPIKRDPLDVAQGLLGLSFEQAQHYVSDYSKRNGLFLRFDLRNPKQAAARIQELIESASNH